MNNELVKNDLMYLGIIIFVAVGTTVLLKVFESSWTEFATNILRNII